MFSTLKSALSIEGLRKKLLFTLFIIVVFRFGNALAVPFVTADALKNMLGDGSLFGYFDMLTGGGFSQSTVFALSVTPYINASIIVQLLTIAFPSLAEIQKEDPRKMSQIVRLTGAALAVLLSTAYYFLLRGQNALAYTTGFSGVFCAIVVILCFTAGSLLIMWLGEQIDVKGIGNGISIIIFAGIISRFTGVLTATKAYLELAAEGQPQYYIYLPIIAVIAVISVAFIVLLNSSERRFPLQYSQVVKGRKMYGGQNSYIPIKVNGSGVMPIIFASAIISLPGTIRMFFNIQTGFWAKALSVFNTNAWGYAIIYGLLIVGFNFFYTASQYNPVEISKNLKNSGAVIPGIRPGPSTAEYFSKSLSRIILIGSLFLIVVALMPIVIGNLTGINIQLGGTSLLIVVGVALEVARQIDGVLRERHQKTLL